MGKFQARQNETALVAINNAVEPFGPRHRPDENEQRGRRHPVDLPAIAATDRDGLETVFTMHLHHLGAKFYGDVRGLANLVDQVP